MDMIEQVNTATLKQRLCHYLGLVRQGKEVLITSHKRIVARLLGRDEDESRLPLREPKEPPASLKDIGGFGFANDPLDELLRERYAR
jgi:antitoxin (DNA-binding transcriptional repressor) of toxin-antitoxin stability system